MRRLIKSFLNDRSGATAIEYAIIITFLSLAIVGALSGVETTLYNLLGSAITAVH